MHDTCKNYVAVSASSHSVIARRYEVFGRVQGVGFRYFVHHTAVRLGLSGWVRNRRDGSVEALAEGSGDTLAQFREALTEGPSMSSVTRVEEHPVGPTALASFRITG